MQAGVTRREDDWLYFSGDVSHHTGSAAPPATLWFVLWTLTFGLGLLLPSLWFLFAVFKGWNPAAEERHP